MTPEGFDDVMELLLILSRTFVVVVGVVAFLAGSTFIGTDLCSISIGVVVVVVVVVVAEAVKGGTVEVTLIADFMSAVLVAVIGLMMVPV